MSGATYRIDVEHDPHMGPTPWYVKVYNLPDDYLPVVTRYAETKEQAVVIASNWIRDETSKKLGFTVYADDEGNSADAPDRHSVKA